MVRKQGDTVQAGHLVKTLCGTEINRLEDAYVALASDLLAQSNRIPECTVNSFDYLNIRDRVLRRERPVNLTAAQKACSLIAAKSERPIEIYNNLCHMEVLIAAITVVRRAGLSPTTCAPTQQSVGDNQEVIADLQGHDWVLEAFGGFNCKSNQKIFEDLTTLNHWSAMQKRFLAFRKEAWKAAYPKKPLSMNGQDTRIEGVTKRTRSQCGRYKVRASAGLRLLEICNDVYVVEVLDLKCEEVPRR
jgi:hypothetical protein